MSSRFTIDGSDALEALLGELCHQVRSAVQSVIPQTALEAIVLGGGYGRGEGGVLRTNAGDRPYNDIEFYVFSRGNPILNTARYRRPLDSVAAELSASAGLHVEFKIDAIAKLRRGEVSMFSYDLVSAHRVITGDQLIFKGCEHHRDALRIPLSEGTRLMLNRCTGLLLARQLLEQKTLSEGDCDFVARNQAKAKLALGDALLTATGQYHWSCRQRQKRLTACCARTGLVSSEALEQIVAHHAAGVDFKLHPRQIRRPVDEFLAEHDALTHLAAEVWLWLESRRLNQPFSSLSEYALNRNLNDSKDGAWRNYLLNARTFGYKALFDPMSRYYPRERLLCSLPLLLRKTELTKQPAFRQHLQKKLRTTADDWQGLVNAYKRVWTGYA